MRCEHSSLDRTLVSARVRHRPVDTVLLHEDRWNFPLDGVEIPYVAPEAVMVSTAMCVCMCGWVMSERRYSSLFDFLEFRRPSGANDSVFITRGKRIIA